MVDSVYSTERYTDEPLTLWDGVDDVARELYTTRDAAAMLNVGQNTLREWAEKAGIHRISDPDFDKRVKGWTRGELEDMARRHHRVLGRPPVEPALTRREREMLARLTKLEQRMAELESRAAGILPRTPPTHSEGQQHPSATEREQLEQVRQQRARERHAAEELLPDGWMAFSTWCDLHNLNGRTADRYVSQGRLPQPTRRVGGYINPASGQQVRRVYSDVQIPLAEAALAQIRASE